MARTGLEGPLEVRAMRLHGVEILLRLLVHAVMTVQLHGLCATRDNTLCDLQRCSKFKIPRDCSTTVGIVKPWSTAGGGGGVNSKAIGKVEIYLEEHLHPHEVVSLEQLKANEMALQPRIMTRSKFLVILSFLYTR